MSAVRHCSWIIGKEVIRKENEYIPAKVTVKEYVSYHYSCPECKNTDESYIIKATTEKKSLMKHSLASPSSVAWTIYQKYANATAVGHMSGVI